MVDNDAMAVTDIVLNKDGSINMTVGCSKVVLPSTARRAINAAKPRTEAGFYLTSRHTASGKLLWVSRRGDEVKPDKGHFRLMRLYLNGVSVNSINLEIMSIGADRFGIEYRIAEPKVGDV
jgi:hypothetical protein